MTKDELLEALLLERYGTHWTPTPAAIEERDNEMACARRRRELDQATRRTA